MMTALEAKLTAYRNKTNRYFHIAESRIEEAAMFGNTECAIEMSEIPGGTIGMMYELASILTELGYQTIFFGEQKTLGIYWGAKKDIVMNIADEYIDEEE
jgi:hypothetical protein